MSVDISRDRGVVTAIINRPEVKNAFDLDTLLTLRALLAEIEDSPSDRCLVISGANGEFCTGADISSFPMGRDSERSQISWMREVHEFARALHRLNVPTIAKVDGLAVGAGLSIALNCDIVVASERSRFSMIFAKRGLSVDFGASWLLPRIVGLAKAKELALTADMVDAPTALSIGLIARMVDGEQLDAHVDELAHTLAQGPTLALSMSKRLMNESFGSSLEQSLEAESYAQVSNFASRDTNEAIKAFREKRAPIFEGR